MHSNNVIACNQYIVDINKDNNKCAINVTGEKAIISLGLRETCSKKNIRKFGIPLP
jgi:hypothetical protein